MTRSLELAQMLEEALPPYLHDCISELVELLQAVAEGTLPAQQAQARIGAETTLAAAVLALAARSVGDQQTGIAFRDNDMRGATVTISGNVVQERQVQLTAPLSILIAPPVDQQVPGGMAMPFRDLQAFTLADEQIFFGRSRLIEEGMRAWVRSGRRFLALVGASGSGKSSLAQAGLLPHVLRDGAAAGRPILAVVLRPDRAPLDSLRDALQRHGLMANSPARGIDIRGDGLAALLHQQPGKVLLVVDQFEEIWTLCPDAAERHAFVATLLAAIHDNNLVPGIILTLRADFYQHCATIPGLRELVAANQILVGPLTPDEMAEAIIKPVETVAHKGRPTFEGGLVDQIVADAGQRDGTLPLLQYCMGRLWRAGALTLAAYRSFGGVQGALEDRAETIYNDPQLQEDGRRAVRRLLVQLVQLGEGTEDTRRRLSLEDLTPADDTSGQTALLVGGLVDARLLMIETTSEGPLVTLSHEALIRSWSRLRSWVDDDRDGKRQRDELRAAARAWERAHRSGDGYLLSGARLELVAEWADHATGFTTLEQEYLQASQAAADAAAAQREAQRQLELEQAQALAEAERERAAEQQRRAEAERQASMRLRGVIALLSLLLLVAIGWLIWLAQGELLRQQARAASNLFEVPGLDIAFERTEVTNSRYALCVAADRCAVPPPQLNSGYYSGADTLPVAGVDAFQAAAFCSWVGRRLPTSDEWEWAARQGGQQPWPWGTEAPTNDRANLPPRGPRATGSPVPVDTLRGTTPQGIADLIGNVWEWTATSWHDPGGEGAVWNGAGASAPTYLVAKGGSFASIGGGIRADDDPTRFSTSYRNADIGFRCVEGR